MAKRNKTLYIIDGHAHIFAAYYAPMHPLTGPGGEPTKVAYIFTSAIIKLIEQAKPDMLVVAMDSKAPSFRKEMYPEYKANRSEMPEDLPGQIEQIEQILAAMNIPVFRIDGFEADDIIGTLTTKASAAGIDSYICSKDKDMLQLIDKHTFTYDIKTGTKTTAQSMRADMGITPEQFIDVLALQGDTSDNIPGLQDVGPKTAIGWIQKYGSIENLYKHADEIKGKRGMSLRDGKDVLSLSRELVTINRGCPVEIDRKTFKVSQPDEDALSKVFTELGFVKLLTQLGLEPAKPPAGADAATPDKTLSSKMDTIKTLKKDYRLVNTREKFDKFYEKLKKQKLFAVDTETTSLSAMRAELVGMSFSWKANSGYYLPVKAPMGAKKLDIKMVRQKLGPILADEKIKKIGQNIKYDMLILHNSGLELGGVYFDTMVASYCLAGERRSHSMDAMAKDFLNYEPVPISSLIGKGKNQLTFDMVALEAAADYAAEDADVTLLLYEYLSAKLANEPEIKKLFTEVEMPLVAVLARMEINGVSLDIGLLKRMSHSIAEKLAQASDKIYEYAGGVFNIDSPKQLAEVLFDRLGLESVRSGKTTRSTDAAVLEYLSGQHEIIPFLLEYRQMVKLKNTYVDKLGQLINPRTNRVHASFNQTITATGRLSSSNPNLQNIPIRTELGKKIRSAFIPADKNDCILSADYSQIELRLLAHFSKDETMVEAFRADEDIHRFVASQVYGVASEDVTEEMRSHCKAVNFGIIYGQGPFGLAKSLGISQGQAKDFIADYFTRYSSIKTFTDETIALAKKTGYAETILHRRRQIKDLNSKNGNKRSQAERLVVNTVIQGSAADLIKVAMINIQRRIRRQYPAVKMILQIHDELVFEMPKAEAKEHAEWIAEEMENAIPVCVPLKVDVSIGRTWLGGKI